MKAKINFRDFENRYNIQRWNASTVLSPMDIDLFRREIKGDEVATPSKILVLKLLFLRPEY